MTEQRVPCVVVTSQRRMLLIQRGHQSKHPHKWCIPGGKEERHETPRKCAVRELQEETGICVDEKELEHVWPLCHYSPIRGENGEYYRLMVYAIDLPLRPVVTVEKGFDGYGWFTADDVKMLQAMEPAYQAALHFNVFG